MVGMSLIRLVEVPLIYFLFPLIYICYLLLNYAREQSRVANAEHPKLQPVQLRAEDREGGVRTCAAGN